MQNEDTYRTIKDTAEGVFRDRGSKFLAFVYPVKSVTEVKSILEKLRKKYHDARHHCYAYRLGASMEKFRANDDGEPSNSAGKPILGQIQSQELTNVLIVVVRYFGGTLLGVGGLINAYRSAAADALEKSQIIIELETDLLTIRFPYDLTNEVMKIIDDEKMSIQEQDFTDSCLLTARVRKSRTVQAAERFNILPGASAELS